MRACLRNQVWNAIQFEYIDGIDGPKTVKYAEGIGLSRNGDGGISKLWEIKTESGWKIVDHGDWILSQPSPWEAGKSIYTVVKGGVFDQDMVLF
jgi:hypothetical protein